MSIKLELDDYCQECEWFDVCVSNDFTNTYTIVSCKHALICDHVAKYIKEQMEKEKTTE